MREPEEHVQIRPIIERDYTIIFDAMRDYTAKRGPGAPDQLWLVEHEPVFTQGRAGKAEHILQHDAVPIVQTDRGGQVTYHGPGQIVIYLLCDTERRRQKTKDFVSGIESAMVHYLEQLGLKARGDSEARGVYIEDKKIGSIGLRMTKKGSYHGLSLNLSMDLTPFHMINPCGYASLQMTQIVDHLSQGKPLPSINKAMRDLAQVLAKQLGYNGHTIFEPASVSDILAETLE
ncbi:MAG: lipoyl(octanoyl) transferase LipB [Pseudomonadota bacterium]|nr:lipoyl(octanoyl) transferase LipB [Pseudomonadota bacterium]